VEVFIITRMKRIPKQQELCTSIHHYLKQKIEQQQIEKRHAIVISGEGGSFVVGTNDAKLGSDWLTALKASSSKPQSSLELKGEVAKMGIMMKAKKKHCWKSCNLCSW